MQLLIRPKCSDWI